METLKTVQKQNYSNETELQKSPSKVKLLKHKKIQNSVLKKCQKVETFQRV